MNEFRETTIEELHLENAAVDADHAVRLDQMNTALSGLAATVHTQLAGTITDLTETVQDIVGAFISDSNDLDWTYNDAGNTVSAAVRLLSNGGLLSGASGLYVNTGSGVGQIAEGNHTHANDHVAMTVVDTDAINLTLSGQQLSATVSLGATSGLEIGAGDGLRCVFGSTAGTVAQGNHTHATDPAVVVGVVDSSSIDFQVAFQLISGTVKLASPPPVNGGLLAVAGAGGLYAVLGTGSGVAAVGNHTHSAASTSVDGFMAAADKLKLDGLGAGGDYYDTTESDARYPLKTELASTQMWVGNSLGVAAARTITGDITMSNSGVATIVASAVTDAKIGLRTVDDLLTPNGLTGTLTELLSDIVSQINLIVTDGAGSWYDSPAIDLGLVNDHITGVYGTNPHNTTKTNIGLANVSNKAQLPLDGTDNMTGPVLGTTGVAIGTTTLNTLVTVSSATQPLACFQNGATARLTIGASSTLLSGIGNSTDGLLKLHTADASLWVIDTSGNARLRLQTLIDGDPGSALNIHYANSIPAVRAILGHGGNTGGYGNLGGVQIVAQGANQADSGGGAIHLFTSTADSAGGSTDAALAARLSIAYDGKIGFGISAPTVAFQFVNDGGVLRLPVKSTTSDPAGGNGDIYYNTTDLVFRAYQNGAWTNLIGGGGGSVAGSTQQIQFNNAGVFGASSALIWDITNTRLGLSMASPSFKLDVGGDVRIAQTARLYFGGTGSGDTTVNVYSNASNQLDISGSINLASTRVFKINGTQMINSSQATGWTNDPANYTPTRGSINSGTITLAQLADRVATAIGDIKTHGLFAT